MATPRLFLSTASFKKSDRFSSLRVISDGKKVDRNGFRVFRFAPTSGGSSSIEDVDVTVEWRVATCQNGLLLVACWKEQQCRAEWATDVLDVSTWRRWAAATPWRVAASSRAVLNLDADQRGSFATVLACLGQFSPAARCQWFVKILRSPSTSEYSSISGEFHVARAGTSHFRPRLVYFRDPMGSVGLRIPDLIPFFL